MTAQPSILADVPRHAAFLFLDRASQASAATVIEQLAAHTHADHLLIGLGSTLLASLEVEIPGMRPHPTLVAPGAAMPRTPSDVLVRISGDDPGEVLHRERAVLAALDTLTVVDRVEAFLFGESRDLTGYEDGTENPEGDERAKVAFQSGLGEGLDDSSVVAVQRWVHDLDAFAAMPSHQQDHTFGRERVSNEELDDAPESAHVKRTAQEDFDPEAFIWRRSMPWRDHRGAGLVFVSFSATLDPFEALSRRMMGEDDGVVDALFSFTRPVTGASYWCPPLSGARLDLRAVAHHR